MTTHSTVVAPQTSPDPRFAPHLAGILTPATPPLPLLQVGLLPPPPLMPSAGLHPSNSWAPPPVALQQSQSFVPPPVAAPQLPLSRAPSYTPPIVPVPGQAGQSHSWVPNPSAAGMGTHPGMQCAVPTAGLGTCPAPGLQWLQRPAGPEAAGRPAVAPAALGPASAVSDLRFVSAAFSRQHPAKVNTGIVNADAVDEGPAHLGICDGVSGVHHLGIPPDELPRELLRSCRARLQAAARPAEADDGTWLTGLIEEAYDATRAYGATTLLLAALRGSDLVTACLGDCALLVLRPCSLQPLRLRPIFKTEPGRYDSRRPVQVQRLHGFSDANAHTVIQGAMVSTTPVLPGDLLVIGSDGLFDNLRDEDIQLAVERGCAGFGGGGLPPPLPDPGRRRSSLQPPTPPALAPGPAQLQRTAEALVELAIARVKLDPPEAERQEPWGAQGGDVPANNADDTTALVAAVVLPDEVDDAGEDEEPLESCAGVINF